MPGRQELISLKLEPGSTVGTAIDKSEIADLFRDKDIPAFQAGIWGKPVDRDRPLQDGDRVEIYRPLIMDPREARRQLAEIGRSMGQRADRVKDPD